jgi:predicted ester cyclase
MMNVPAPKALVTEYLEAVSGEEKTRSLLERYVSSTGLLEHVLAIEAGFPRYKLEVLDVVAEGDRVACRLLFRGTHRGDFQGLEATGREATMSVFAFYEVVDGRIADAWILADGADLMEQLAEE